MSRGKPVIGLRRESKDPAERRVPLIPAHVRRLAEDHGLEVVVQPSPARVFPDEEYVRAGATIATDLSRCTMIFGVKEVPTEELLADKVYCFFSHTTKGQPHNMPMLRRLLELGCTLLDYELVKNDKGRRIIAFGTFAGYAGMVNTLWALGRRLRWEGIDNPFDRIRRPHRYTDLGELTRALREVGKIVKTLGLPPAVVPCICGLTGQGRVSRGAREMLKLLPTARVEPDELPRFVARGDFSDRVVYRVDFHQADMYEPRDAQRTFDWYRFHRYPEEYVARVERLVPHLTMLVNGIYWEPRYPRLVTRSFLRGLYESNPSARLKVIGDITCDVEGSIEVTVRPTTIDDPVYVYEPLRDRVAAGVEGIGPVVMAVDKLPTELPRQASEAFSDALFPFVAALAATDYARPLGDLELPAEFAAAVIAHRGGLAPSFGHLRSHLP